MPTYTTPSSPTVTSLTIPRSVIGLPISGSCTFCSALCTSSVLGSCCVLVTFDTGLCERVSGAWMPFYVSVRCCCFCVACHPRQGVHNRGQWTYRQDNTAGGECDRSVLSARWSCGQRQAGPADTTDRLADRLLRHVRGGAACCRPSGGQRLRRGGCDDRRHRPDVGRTGGREVVVGEGAGYRSWFRRVVRPVHRSVVGIVRLPAARLHAGCRGGGRRGGVRHRVRFVELCDGTSLPGLHVDEPTGRGALRRAVSA